MDKEGPKYLLARRRLLDNGSKDGNKIVAGHSTLRCELAELESWSLALYTVQKAHHEATHNGHYPFSLVASFAVGTPTSSSLAAFVRPEQ